MKLKPNKSLLSGALIAGLFPVSILPGVADAASLVDAMPGFRTTQDAVHPNGNVIGTVNLVEVTSAPFAGSNSATDNLTSITWKVTESQNTIWLKMNHGSLADEFFSFKIIRYSDTVAASGTGFDPVNPGTPFSAVWVDIWNVPGNMSPPDTTDPNFNAWTVNAGQSDPGLTQSISATRDIGLSITGEREVVKVDFDTNNTGGMIDGANNEARFSTGPSGGETLSERIDDGCFTGGCQGTYEYPYAGLWDDFNLTGEEGSTFYLSLTVVDPSALPTSLPGNNNVVPLPAAFWMFGSAILGLAAVSRRKG